MDNNQGLELLATKEIDYNEGLYIIVDFLNKTLKDRELVFGLALSDDNKAVISIYNA